MKRYTPSMGQDSDMPSIQFACMKEDESGNYVKLSDVANVLKKHKTLSDEELLEEAQKFCQKVDNEEGEVWSNDYDELPEKMAEFTKQILNKK